jgi:energy-coupling factor transporter ATP-binding protein EcfA2
MVTDDEFYNSVKVTLEGIAKNESTLLSMWNCDYRKDREHIHNERIGLYWENDESKKKTKWWNLIDQFQYGRWRRVLDNSPKVLTFGICLGAWGVFQHLYTRMSWMFENFDWMFSSRITAPFHRVLPKLLHTEAEASVGPLAIPTIISTVNKINTSGGFSYTDRGLFAEEMDRIRVGVRNLPYPDDDPERTNIFNSAGVVHEFRKASKGSLWRQLLLYCKLADCVVGSMWYMPAYVLIYLCGIRLYRLYKASKRAYTELWSVSELARSGQRLFSLCEGLPLEQRNALTLLPELFSFASTTDEFEVDDLLGRLRGNTRIFNPGHMLWAHNKISELKKPLSKVLEAVGQLDAFYSLATLYRERVGKENAFCFPTYSDQSQPLIEVTGVWDPLTGADEAVPNDMTLGIDGGCRNAMIAGPNAGGKSTLMRSMFLAILMAQTFGMAPATLLSITLFSYLDSYVNIEDDPVKKKSLHMMQAHRINMLLWGVLSLGPTQFAFVIADEMFNGTNPIDAPSIGRAVANKICKLANSIWLISTHYPDMLEVEKDSDGIFANYEVGVNRYQDGRFKNYTFKATRCPIGAIMTESTAIDVLEMEGFDPEISSEARRLSGRLLAQ